MARGSLTLRERWAQAVVLAAAISLAMPALAAAQDPAPVPSPSNALQQPLTDGCQRNPLGLLTFTSPEWVYVYSHQPGIDADPTSARVAEGTVDNSDPAVGDLPQGHNYYDFTMDMTVQSQYQYLLGGDPSAHTGNYQDANPILHLEWESGTVPSWAWPSDGDSVKAWGSWIWDCGHWGQEFTSDLTNPQETVTNDLDYFLPGTGQNSVVTGERTELHPMQALVVTRSAPSTTTATETETDAFISNQGTKAKAEQTCAREHPATNPDAYPPGYTNCVTKAAKRIQRVNDRDYTFFAPAPPQPSPGATLEYHVVNHNPSGAAPNDHVQVLSNGIEVTVPFNGFTSLSKTQAFGKSYFVGWSNPPAPAPTHMQVVLKSVTINNSLDGHPQDGQAALPPGEWNLYTNVNGQWQLINSYASDLNRVDDGDVVNLKNHTIDAYVQPGEPLRLEVTGRECDIPAVHPCPTTAEFAADNDNPGKAVATYTDLNTAVGTHTLSPDSGYYTLTYEVKQP